MERIQILYSYINREKHEFLLKEVLPSFSLDFQRKILKYRRWQDAQLSLLGRVLIKEGFKKINMSFCDENLKYTSYGKPYLDGEKVKFNISHSGDIVICVISHSIDVGIDIEVIQNIELESFRPQMTDLEWDRIIASNNMKNAFFEYWTQKEAVIKAHGMGLSMPLKSFEIIDYQTGINEKRFFLKEIKLNTQYKCHLALKNNVHTTIYRPMLINIPICNN